MCFNLTFGKLFWITWQENGRTKKKLIKPLDDEYQIIYGLGFYDGARAGIAKRLSDDNRFYFMCEENQETNQRLYALFDLNETQWQNIDEEIKLLEHMAGTHCRYVNGRRIVDTHPDYLYRVTEESWKEYFKILREKKLGHNYINIFKEQLIGCLTSEQLYNKGTK